MMQGPLDTEFVTLSVLARRLGIPRQSVYGLIERHAIPEPQKHPETGALCYDERTAHEIAIWWLRKMARGETRGPHSLQRMQRARKLLREAQELAAHAG